MPRYLVQVLGPPVVADTRSGATIEFPAGKTLALLAYLVLHSAPPLREQLYHLLWGDSPRDRGLQSVRQALWLIRHTFGESALSGRDGTEIDRELLGSDVAQLNEAIAANRIEDAERLWRGPFLDRFAVVGAPEWDAWVEETRLGLEHEFGAALAAAAAVDAARGDGDAAAQRYTRAIQVEPFRLEHRLALIDLLLELHRGTDAEQALDAARGALPDPEFAKPFGEREARLREVLRDRALEPVAALSRPELVGRAHELSDLIGRWNVARRGRTQRVVLHGRSGVGKTRLAEELGSVVEQDRGKVVVVKTTEPESLLPWATVATLVRRLLVLPGAGGVSAGSDAVLRRLVPSLARQAPGEAAHAVPEPAVLADALADLIGAVAYEAPLLLVLDDGQWIDQGSWALLSRLLTQIESEPVLFLLTVRDGEAPPQVDRALARVRRGSTALDIRLSNLSRAETAELLTFVLGSEQAAEGGIGDRIYGVTQGNPLFIVETTKMLRDVGALRLAGERWVFDPSRVPEHFPLPATIEQLLRQRVEHLSATAERIARLLAQRGAPQDIASLQPEGVSRTAWADAIAELVERGVVLRTGEGYVLAHEQIAAVVRAGPGRPRRRRLIAGVVGIAIAAVGVAAAGVVYSGKAPFGGGTIVLRDGLDMIMVEPARGFLKQWRVRRESPGLPANAILRSVRRTVDGQLRMGADMMKDDASPYALEIRPKGPRVLYQIRTDAGVVDISPDGTRFLVGWDDPATDTIYDTAIGWIVPGEPGPHLVKQTPAFAYGRWSADGLAIAVHAHGAGDSLHILSPDGVRLAGRDATGVLGFSWCPDGSMLLLHGPDRRGLTRYFPRGDSLGTALKIETFGRWLLCGPDSRFAALPVVRDGLAALSVVDLATGRATNLPDSLRGLELIAWLPDRIDPIPVVLRVPEVARLPLGRRWRPPVRVVLSDGSSQRVSVALSSSDPRVLAIAPAGVVIGNSPGTASLTARYQGWLTGRTEVTVTQDQDATLLLRDDFEFVDTARWEFVGTPQPQAVAFESDTVLQLNGDGNFQDGLATRQHFSAAEGLTAEIEFQLKPTRKERQRIILGLCPLPATRLAVPFDCDGAHAMVQYPYGELSDFDDRTIALGAFGDGDGFPIAPAVPSERWTHLAILLYPDGYVEAVVDRRVVGRSRLRHPNPEAQPWRVFLFGSSVDTRVLVRDLRVWRGVQYGSPRD